MNSTIYNRISIDEKISNICRNEYKYFLKYPNVIGVGLGYRVIKGFYTCEKCIKVFVDRKIARNILCNKYKIPKIYKGIKTDVVEKGRAYITSLTSKIRPVIGGYSIGPEILDYAGTFGCLVTDGVSNYVLGNNHTLAGDNKFGKGTKILQPSLEDGGKLRKDVVATLSKFIPLKFINNTNNNENIVDCAIGKVTNEYIVSSKIAFVGAPRGVIKPKLGENIQKVGAITELTTGKITEISATFTIDYDGKNAIFKDQIVTTPMSKKGDSGAILLNNQRYAIGFLAAKFQGGSIYNSMDNVLKELNVKLVTT